MIYIAHYAHTPIPAILAMKEDEVLEWYEACVRFNTPKGD